MTRAVAGLLLACTLLAGCEAFWRWDGGRTPATTHRVAGPGEYVVKRGDTLYSIAFRNNLDYRELAAWNHIGSDYLIHAGQVLRLTPPSGRRPTVIVRNPPRAAAPERSVSASPASPSTTPPASYAWRWPTEGAVVRGFSPQSGTKGLDIGGSAGQDIVAAAPGKVVYSGAALKGYGELIIIKHDEDLLSAYGYNRKRLVQEGETVAAGQRIAEMGAGPEQKPMLHFEIREQGRPVDPTGYLPRR